MPQVLQQLPKYKCHKEVWAVKIAKIEQHTDGSATFSFDEPGVAPIVLSQDYMMRHLPQEGGYLVIYEPEGDNPSYESWSPAATFERGYTRIG